MWYEQGRTGCEVVDEMLREEELSPMQNMTGTECGMTINAL